MITTFNNSRDYSLKVANTGIATLNTANPNLDGSGAVSGVVSGGSVIGSPNAIGTRIKSITIKATGPVDNGMVRLFLQNNVGPGPITLWKEVPIPTSPVYINSTPPPAYPLYKITLKEELLLPYNWNLLASTNNEETYNVFAEGYDYAYPTTPSSIPSTDSNYEQEYANIGMRYDIPGYNGTLVGGITNAATAFQANPSYNGATLKSITIKAQQSTLFGGIFRIFIGSDYFSLFLFKEVVASETIQSSVNPALSIVIPCDDFKLQKGYYVCVLSNQMSVAQNFNAIIEGYDWGYPYSY